MRSRRVVRRDERGVTLVIVALMIVVIMTFAAFAVDLGGAYNQRRQFQSAADAGALAGAQILAESPPLSPDATVIAYVNKSVGTNFPDADFNTCAGDTPPAFTPGTPPGVKTTVAWVRDLSYNCIAVDTTRNLIWADVPHTQPYKSAFAGIVGMSKITIGASAVAEIVPQGLGGVLPFGAASTASPGLNCVVNSPPDGGTGAGSCLGLKTPGNFGYLQFNFYGNPFLGTTCKQSYVSSPELANNIAVGVDHQLSLIDQPPGSGSPIVDGSTSSLTICGPQDPNSTSNETGNTAASKFSEGILTGRSPAGTPFSDGNPAAKLARTTNEATLTTTFNPTTTIAGVPNVDDTGLWRFIPESLNGSSTIPSSCYRSTFDATALTAVAMTTALTKCFTDYGLGCDGAPCGPLFVAKTGSNPFIYDIQESPRFAYIPQLTPTCPGPPNCSAGLGSSGTVSFKNFLPIYIQNLTGTTFTFDPGVGEGCPPQTGRQCTGGTVSSMSAYTMYANMLPGTLGTNPFQEGQSFTVQLAR